MASRRTLINQIKALEPRIRDAFLQAIADIRGEVSVRILATLIEEGRIEDVADILGLDAARFSELIQQVRQAYYEGGLEGVREIPLLNGPGGSRVRVRFDMTNPRAEAWLSTHSAALIAEITAEQMLAIRDIVSRGTMAGRNPRDIALDIIGRIGVTGRRTGGIIGLTSQQARYVLNAREQLLSGNPSVMRDYFSRVRRDRRFDSLVRRAIEEGRAVSVADVDRITARYADRLLQLRGESIARTEALTAFSTARDQAFKQAIDTGLIAPENIEKEWSSSGDDRVRETHMDMDGQTVGINEPFVSSTGSALMYPGDTSLGAGPEDVINCRCQAIYKVNQIAEALR